FVGLVDLAHHQLRSARMYQSRHAPRLLDLVGNPIPVGRGFNGYRSSRGTTQQCLPNRCRCMLQPILPRLSAVSLLVFHPRIMLVTVECDIFFHSAAPFTAFATASLRRRQESRFHIFILSASDK